MREFVDLLRWAVGRPLLTKAECPGGADDLVAFGPERFRIAFDSAPIGVALVSAAGRYLEVNDALCLMVGHEREALHGLTFADLTHPEDLASTLERKQKQLRGEPGQTRIEKRYVRADGTTIWVAVSSTLVRNSNGEPLYSVAQIEDITQRIQTQRALDEAQERFRRAFDDAPIGMALVSPDGRFLRTNEKLAEITGYSERQLLELTFQEITHPDDVDADVEQAEQLLAGAIRSYHMEKRYIRSDGQPIWIMLSVSLVRDSDGEPLHFISQIEDISDRKHAERELRYLADYDGLTGLLNRRRLDEELQRERRLIRRQPARRSLLLLLDVDYFKRVNDRLGHKAGDDALRAVAQTLTRRLRATDVIARLGGDEFAAILADVSDPDDAWQTANEIATAIRSQTILTSGGAVSLTVSIGVVVLEHTSIGAEDTLVTADHAMYAAKRNGRDRIELVA